MILQHHMEDTGQAQEAGTGIPGVGNVDPCEASPIFLGPLVFTNQIHWDG